MRLTTWVLPAAVVLQIMPVHAQQVDSGTPPNVVIVFIDDMGYGDIGPFGATKQKTPCLDRMATEGMQLTSFYAAPVCSVSRAQLLTGCYGARVSVPGVFGPGSKAGLNPNEVTIPERLKERGYATACIGKWHLGDQPEFLPTRQGFDHYLGIPYSNDMQRTSTESGQRVVPLVCDGKVQELLTDEAQERIEERYTEDAVKFIRANKDRPFFLYFPHTAVHVPIYPGKAFQGRSDNGRFGDWVEELDWSTGRILDTLRELKLDKNTLVIFTSDNGPWLVKGTDAGTAKPLRGGKGSTWEGGVRVPTIAWWPGRIEPGSVCDTVTGTIDLLPTCVALAGGTVPPDPVIDGRDISGVLLGKTTEAPREAHYYFSQYNLDAVRQGCWKLAVRPQRETMGRAAEDDAKGPQPRLYNLDTDIGETTDVAGQHPEIVKSLQALAEKMKADLAGSPPNGRRPAGIAENATMLYPAEARRKRGKTVPKRPLKPVDLSGLKPGATLSASDAPQIGGRPFSVSCTVATKQRDAILVAHGGLSVGYALYLRDGKAVFCVRNGKGSVEEIVSPEPVPNAARLVASLAKDGAMVLKVNGQTAAKGKTNGLIADLPQENFCIGHDDAKPLTEYPQTVPFSGTIDGLQVTSP